MTNDDVRYMFVGNYTGATGLSHGSRMKDVTDLSDGEMVVVNAVNTVLTENNIASDDLATNDGIVVAFRSGDQVYRTPKLKASNMLSYAGQTDSAAANQVTYIGYDTSGNSIDFTAGDVSSIHVEFYEASRQGFGTPHIETHAYTIGANDTQIDIARNLAKYLAASMNRRAHKPIKTEVMSSNTTTSTPGETASVYNGEKFFTTSETLAAGQYARFGGTGTSYGVYKIKSVDNTNNRHELHMTYEGADATLATGSWEYMTESNAESADAGIKLSGLDKKWELGKFKYGVYRFDVNISNLGTTVVGKATDADPGNGTYEEVAENEWLYQGNEGNPYRRDFMHTTARSDAASGNAYDQISIRCYNDQETSSVGYVRSPIEVVLAFKTGYTAGQSPDVVATALDTYFGKTSGLNI